MGKLVLELSLSFEAIREVWELMIKRYILIFGIFLGQTVGFMVFGRDTVGGHNDANSGNCC